MWPTVDGLRVLKLAEAELFRCLASVVVAKLTQAYRSRNDVEPCGIDWFDQWDVEQQIWLVDQVAAAMLTSHSPPRPAAIWEATVDAIFCELIDLIRTEIESDAVTSQRVWRQRVIDAYRSQHGKLPPINAAESDLVLWQRLVTQIADTILGAASYQKAESFRDRDIKQAERFLERKGLPEDFLQRLPPLRSDEETDESLRRLKSILA